MLVIFETESGAIVTDEIFVRTGVAYEVRTEVVGERGSALIGLDQNLQVEVHRRPLGRHDHAGLRGAFRRRRTTSSCSAGWTRRRPAPSTARVPGTAMRLSRSARPAYRHSGVG